MANSRSRGARKKNTALANAKKLIEQKYNNLKVIRKVGPTRNTRYVKKVKKGVYLYTKKS